MARKKEEKEAEKQTPVPEEKTEVPTPEVAETAAGHEEVNVITETDIKEVEKEKVPAKKTNLEIWIPRTEIGKKVKAGEITKIEEILDSGKKVLEFQIVDALLPSLESDLLMIGQSKGKFGGGKRRAFRQTQKKTKEGNKPKFTTYAVIGNKDGYVGLGYGKAKETVPAREKAFRNAKLNVFKIRRGCGSWECNCKTAHSIPYKVTGRCGSVKVTLMPAPKGTGLCAEKECAKIMNLAGIKDVWTQIIGQSNTKMNTIKACEFALKSLMTTRIHAEGREKLSICEGPVQHVAEAQE